MPVYIYTYDSTVFRVRRSGEKCYIPEYKNFNMSDYKPFEEKSHVVSRARQADALKYIRRRAKVAEPLIELYDQHSERSALADKLADLLRKKLDASYWKQLDSAELAAFTRIVDSAYEDLRKSGASAASIELIEVQAGMYQSPRRASMAVLARQATS